MQGDLKKASHFKETAQRLAKSKPSASQNRSTEYSHEKIRTCCIGWNTSVRKIPVMLSNCSSCSTFPKHFHHVGGKKKKNWKGFAPKYVYYAAHKTTTARRLYGTNQNLQKRQSRRTFHYHTFSSLPSNCYFVSHRLSGYVCASCVWTFQYWCFIYYTLDLDLNRRLQFLLRKKI